MISAPLVVLGACVLANCFLCDTLLRLAEPPPLFESRSQEMIRETNTLESKLRWPGFLTAHFETEMRVLFPEAWISGYGQLIPRLANDEKDGQVKAAAGHGGEPIIAAFHLRHFRP